ncbi:MAG: NAD(P)-dependent oxidoreductase [Bdellovibrionales bacterium]|nr:NAD(P)-dependent oxidoreductase [Bdellovibrionales bacterium]
MMKNNFDAPLVVVFGGAGYIGSVLTRLLLKDGYRVRVFDNFLFGDHGIQHIASHEGLEIMRGDLGDTCSVSSACRNADAVILLAAIVGRRGVDIRHPIMRDINFLSSSVVLDAAIEHGASRFIFASTDSVYGIQSGLMYETATPEPVTLYSRLKLRMEERVINARTRGFHPTALRIATCHGFSPRMRFDLAANGMIRDAVCKRVITVIGGEQWRPMVHVDDVARAFMACMLAHENLVSGEVFNVGSNEQNVQIREVAKLVHKLVPEAEVNFVEDAPDLVDYRLSCSKIEKILDFKPQWTLEASITQTKEMLENGDFGEPYRLKYQNT